MSDLVDIGSSHLDPDTNVLFLQAKSSPMGDDEEDAPPFDDVPHYGQLGVTARPYHKTPEGNVQGVVDTSLPGSNGAVTSMRDARAACAKVVEELGEGESALHSTGPGFDARVFCKEQMVATMVGDDCAVVLDRADKKYSICCFGHVIEVSEANGINLVADGAGIQIKDGMVVIFGKVILGGRVPIGPVQFGPAPVAGVTGASAPSPGVFIGA